MAAVFWPLLLFLLGFLFARRFLGFHGAFVTRHQLSSLDASVLAAFFLAAGFFGGQAGASSVVGLNWNLL